MKKEWKKVTSSVWVCGEWAVEDYEGYVCLYRGGESVRDFRTVARAKRGATQKTLEQVARWRAESRATAQKLTKLKEVAA
jgi:hypothetical protein